MSELVPLLPAGWTVRGSLRDTEHVELLNGDMLEASFAPGNLLIHVGWEPEEDPQGHYRIWVLRDCDPIAGPFTTASMTEAAGMLMRLALCCPYQVQALADWSLVSGTTVYPTEIAIIGRKPEFEIGSSAASSMRPDEFAFDESEMIGA